MNVKTIIAAVTNPKRQKEKYRNYKTEIEMILEDLVKAKRVNFDPQEKEIRLKERKMLLDLQAEYIQGCK